MHLDHVTLGRPVEYIQRLIPVIRLGIERMGQVAYHSTSSRVNGLHLVNGLENVQTKEARKVAGTKYHTRARWIIIELAPS